MLAGFARRIDRAALSAGGADLDASKRDRLFDALMRRLDAMAPYREGLREIVAWVKRNPTAALAMNASVINSLRFALASAGIESEGVAGAIKLQGLALAWTRIVGVWLDDFRRTSARRWPSSTANGARRASGRGGGRAGEVRRAVRRGGPERLRQEPARRRRGAPPGARRGRPANCRSALAANRLKFERTGKPGARQVERNFA